MAASYIVCVTAMFLDAIAANLDDPAPYLVYADHLQQQGDPRGELIALQHARLTRPRDRTLEDAERDFLKQHEDHLLGPLAAYQDMLPARAWHLGFLRAVTIRNTYERTRSHEGELPEIAVEDLLAQLLDAESGRFLRDLTVGIVTFEDNDYGGVIRTLASQPRPYLHTLYLGDFVRDETELNWSQIGNVEPLYAAVPDLRSLTLRSGSMTLGTIRLPALREFHTVTGGLCAIDLASIVDAHWPQLETLSLQIGSSDYGSDVEPAHLAPLLARSHPTLRHLALANYEHTDDIIPLLAASKLLPQLRSLDLSEGTLGNDGARLLVEHAAAFRHLEKLDLSSNWLHGDIFNAVRAICPNVVVADQRYNPRRPDARYIGAGE